jgi:hypothetical protein
MKCPVAVRSERGIHGVILLSADGEAITSGNWDDELAIIANIQSLLSASQELSCAVRVILFQSLTQFMCVFSGAVQ